MATMFGASLLWKPPWPMRIVGRGPVPPSGHQCSPGTTWPSTERSKRRQTTPSTTFSLMISMSVPFGSAVQDATARLLGVVAAHRQPFVAVRVVDGRGRRVEEHHRAPLEVVRRPPGDGGVVRVARPGEREPRLAH